MAEDKTTSRSELLALTSEIVSAHLSNNSVAQTDVAPLIQSVFDRLNTPASNEAPTPVELTPAVPIKRSITDDYIVCLEDGKKLKMLKRHLMTAYNMTPEEYRAKWGLKPNYPMVAPSYSVQRQTLAKQIGLGRRRGSLQSPGPRSHAPGASRRPEAQPAVSAESLGGARPDAHGSDQ
jgi:predicted transcriptional regulator